VKDRHGQFTNVKADCTTVGKNVGWLQDSENNSTALNGISKTDVPSANEQISELITIIRNDKETTDEAILRTLQYYVGSLPFSRVEI
jgi:hypothetical protein